MSKTTSHRIHVWSETRNRQLRVRWRHVDEPPPGEKRSDYRVFDVTPVGKQLADEFAAQVRIYKGLPPEPKALEGQPLIKPVPGTYCSLTMLSTWAIAKMMPGITQPRTREDYLRDMTNVFVPLFQYEHRGKKVERDIREIDWDPLHDWIDEMTEEGMNPKRIKNLYYIIFPVLDCAVELGMITVNPLWRKSKYLPARTKAPIRKMKLSEWTLLRMCIAVQWRPIADVLLGTGIRWGELAGLRVIDVVFDGDHGEDYLDITRAYKRTRDGRWEMGDTKTYSGRRRVPLDDVTAQVLREAVTGKELHELVFTGTEGDPLRYNNFHTRVWSPAIAKAGLTEIVSPTGEVLAPGMRIHDLRHTYVGWHLEQAGKSKGEKENVLQKVSRWVGHKSIAFTYDIYGTWVTHDSSSERASMGALLRQAQQEGNQPRLELLVS